MLTDNEYLVAWGVYLVAVIGLGVVWWQVTRAIGVRWLQNIFRVLYFALLVTPALVVDGSVRMAPAAMIWILESTIVEADDISRVYAPLGVAVTVSLLLGIAEALLHKKNPSE